jgi:hypothetical protein
VRETAAMMIGLHISCTAICTDRAGRSSAHGLLSAVLGGRSLRTVRVIVVVVLVLLMFVALHVTGAVGPGAH